MELPFELWQCISNQTRLWEQIYVKRLNSKFYTNIIIREIVKPSIIYHFVQEKYKKTYGDKVMLIKKDTSYSIFRICEGNDFAIMNDVERIIVNLLPKKDRLSMSTKNTRMIRFSSQELDTVRNTLTDNGYIVILV